MAAGKRMSVAVLGTGIMGAAMARNLLGADHDVRVWNRTRARAEALAGDGAAVADTPAEAAHGAGAVVTMLTDAAAVEGALDGTLRPGMLVLQMSTIGLAGAARIGELCHGAGALYVDAPVLGTKQPAEEGKLIVLASGPEDAQRPADGVFDVLGQRTMWLGDAGAGTRLKLVAQNWVLTIVEGLAETIALAHALDIDPTLFLDAIDGGPLGPAYAQIKGKMMIDGDFAPSFTLSGARKDVSLVLEAARASDLELALAPAILERFDRAIELGHGDEDMAASIAASLPGARAA